MSASIVTIFCDGCGWWWSDGGSTAKEARSGLHQQGWLVAQPGGLDFCTDCLDVSWEVPE